jgi:hypothetical protein
MHTMEFGQAYCKDIFKRVHTKFTLYFFIFIQFIMKFGILNEFTGNLNQKSISKNGKC